jgi:hypothetical protein
MKKLLVICAAMVICACASKNGTGKRSGGDFSNNYWVTLPRSGELVVLGVSGRQSSRNAEINIAAEDAARKISMYYGVWANAKYVQRIGTGYLDYYVDSEKRLEYDQQLDKYKEKLKFDPARDITRNEDGAVFIRFTYPINFPGNISYKSGKNQDGSPEWTTKRPQVDGFIVGVGVSGRQERLGNTVRKSYEDAVFSIVSNYSSTIDSSNTSIGSATETYIYQESEGLLVNFLVLEVWIDPKSRAVYTLAIANQLN